MYESVHGLTLYTQWTEDLRGRFDLGSDPSVFKKNSHFFFQK